MSYDPPPDATPSGSSSRPSSVSTSDRSEPNDRFLVEPTASTGSGTTDPPALWRWL